MHKKKKKNREKKKEKIRASGQVYKNRTRKQEQEQPTKGQLCWSVVARGRFTTNYSITTTTTTILYTLYILRRSIHQYIL